MKFRYFWIIAICLIVLFGTSCNKKCGKDKEDEEIKE